MTIETKPSLAERRFDEFLKQQELHITQSTCGLGWTARNYSNSGRYSHSVALDFADPTVRTALPNSMGNRSIFRFMISSGTAAPHLTVSNQQLEHIPGVQLTLPKNPSLELDIAALLMLVKSQALRTLDQHEVPLSPANVTLLMAIWIGYSQRREHLGDAESALVVEEQHPEIMRWLGASAPAYLTLLKFVRPEQAAGLSLEEALEARGIPNRQIAVLYPIEKIAST